MVDEKIIEMVRRCLALSKSSNEHEAALAMAKAQEILFKYNLSMDTIQTAETQAKRKSTLTENTISTEAPKNYGLWKPTLLFRIAKYNFCSVLAYTGGHTCLIIGQPYNIEVVKELFNWIVEQLMRMSTEAIRDYHGPDRPATFRRGFFEGATNTIGNRLYQQWVKLQQAAVTSTALVIRNDAAIAEYIDNRFGKLKNGRSHAGSRSYDGHQAGREAGNRVDLSVKKKLEGGSQNLLGGR